MIDAGEAAAAVTAIAVTTGGYIALVKLILDNSLLKFKNKIDCDIEEVYEKKEVVEEKFKGLTSWMLRTDGKLATIDAKLSGGRIIVRKEEGG